MGCYLDKHKWLEFKLQRGQKKGIWKEKQWQIPFQTWGECILTNSTAVPVKQKASSQGKD